MAISYTSTEDSVNSWTKHFMLMSEDNISPLVPGYYRVSEAKEKTPPREINKPQGNCPSNSEEERVPISISTPSEQIVEVIQSDFVDNKKHTQATKAEPLNRKRKGIAVEAAGNKRPKNSVKYSKDPRKSKKFIAW